MFTIKHIDPKGDESLIECDRFALERRSDGFMQYMAYGPNPMPNDYIATWCGDDSLVRQTIDAHVIYVMNRFGATVATHRFVDPDHSKGAATAQGIAVDASGQLMNA